MAFNFTPGPHSYPHPHPRVVKFYENRISEVLVEMIIFARKTR
jgi:hypothetical protein